MELSKCNLDLTILKSTDLCETAVAKDKIAFQLALAGELGNWYVTRVPGARAFL